MADKSELIRCFIAIDFPDEVIKEVARVQEEVSKMKFTGKMTEIENLHLTLKFLGEIDADKVEEVKKKLSEVKFKEFEGKLGSVGTFSILGNPRIIWIKVGGNEIWELQKEIDLKMKELGFKMEERFMSHLTIARLKYIEDKKSFIEHIKKVGVKEIKFKVREFKLKKSDLQLLGPVYTDINTYVPE